MNICKKIDEYEKSQKKQSSENKLFFISIKSDGIYLDDVKIIDKKAELQFAIFMILIDWYVEEFYAQTSKYISIAQINLQLKSKGFDLDDPERQISISIYHIRNSIKSVYENLQINSVIETKKWKGYRLSKHIVLKKIM